MEMNLLAIISPFESIHVEGRITIELIENESIEDNHHEEGRWKPELYLQKY